MRLEFFTCCAAFSLVLGIASCRHSEPEPITAKPTAALAKSHSKQVFLPPPPPIRNPSLPPLYGRDEQRIAAIAAPVSALEHSLMRDPLWNYADLFDNPQIANAIDNALDSRNNSKVFELGGPRALKFSEELQSFNASLSSFSAAAGVKVSPIEFVISGDDFRYQIASRERTIADFLSESPGINKKHVDWLYEAADALNPH